MIRHRGWPSGPDSNGNDEVTLSPLLVIGTLARRWRMLVLVPLLTAVVAAACAIVFRQYTARSRFVTQSSRGDMSRFAGIAAQIGLSVGESPSESPDFYVDLIESGEVLRPAVVREYRFAKRYGSADTVSGTWLELLDVDGDSEEERVQNGIDELRERVNASASIKSGVVTMRTRAPWAGLAEGVNAALLELLAGFDRERRQAGARAERTFVEDRFASAKTELNAAEAQLATFLDRNRRPESPRLMMDLERLQRQVATRQEVYVALAQAYEQARIEEVRNTPVITVVDRPDGSARGSRGLRFAALMGLLLGFIVAVGLAFLADYVSRRADSPEMIELRRLVRRAPRKERVAGVGS
jgi:uncharacterized protein involved in exopolysaccharide biosynthesis